MVYVTDHPGETESIVPQETLRDQQEYILNNTNWRGLLSDYIWPPDDQEQKRWLEYLPTIINCVIAESPDEVTDLISGDLAAISEDLKAFGYVQDPTKYRRPVGIHRNPRSDLVGYVHEWEDYTEGTHYYLRSDRQNNAITRMPRTELKKILGIEYIGRDSTKKGTLPWQIESALWEITDSVIDKYEQSDTEAPKSEYNNIQIVGLECIRPYLEPEKLIEILNVAQHSCPPDLMRGINCVELTDIRETFDEAGVDTPLFAEVVSERNLLRICVANISDYAKRKIAESTKDTQDEEAASKIEEEAFCRELETNIAHELAHVIHNNAPIGWLRRMEKLIRANPIPITPYAFHAHKVRHDKGRPELVADSIQVYNGDPLVLLGLSEEYFKLIDELMNSYDWHSVHEAYGLKHHGYQQGSREYDRVNKLLANARHAKLTENLKRVEKHGSPLGKVSVYASTRP
jgi:hypothetical protein